MREEKSFPCGLTSLQAWLSGSATLHLEHSFSWMTRHTTLFYSCFNMWKKRNKPEKGDWTQGVCHAASRCSRSCASGSSRASSVTDETYMSRCLPVCASTSTLHSKVVANHNEVCFLSWKYIYQCFSITSISQNICSFISKQILVQSSHFNHKAIRNTTLQKFSSYKVSFECFHTCYLEKYLPFLLLFYIQHTFPSEF